MAIYAWTRDVTVTMSSMDTLTGPPGVGVYIAIHKWARNLSFDMGYVCIIWLSLDEL